MTACRWGKGTDIRTLNLNGRGSHGTANVTFTLAFPSKLVAIRVEVPTGVLAPSVTAIAAAKRKQVSPWPLVFLHLLVFLRPILHLAVHRVLSSVALTLPCALLRIMCQGSVVVV
jgi:hypothetical protein